MSGLSDCRVFHIKRASLMVLALVAAMALGLGLAACGGGQARIEPPEIHYGQDLCDHCGMVISDARFAAATVVEVSQGRTETRIFDDVGGMFLYHRQHPERVVARYVHDYESKEWLHAEEAFFVRSAEIHSPMAHGVIACRTREEAERLAAHFDGEVMHYDGLVTLAESGAFDRMRDRMDTQGN